MTYPIAAITIAVKLDAAFSASGNREPGNGDGREDAFRNGTMTGAVLAGCLLLCGVSGLSQDALNARHDAGWTFTLAQTSVLDDADDPLRYGIEYRFPRTGKWQLQPLLGITTAANGASFVYADVRRDFPLNPNWSVTASFGLGRYDPDDIPDLGHKLEFRTGAAIAWHSPSNYRVELGLFHFSNGGISHRNPGTEALVLAFGIPADRD